MKLIDGIIIPFVCWIFQILVILLSIAIHSKCLIGWIKVIYPVILQ